MDWIEGTHTDIPHLISDPISMYIWGTNITHLTSLFAHIFCSLLILTMVTSNKFRRMRLSTYYNRSTLSSLNLIRIIFMVLSTLFCLLGLSWHVIQIFGLQPLYQICLTSSISLLSLFFSSLSKQSGIRRTLYSIKTNHLLMFKGRIINYCQTNKK